MAEAAELQMLRDSARRLVEDAMPERWSSGGRTGRSNPRLWSEMAANGWLFAGLDPDRGGFGFGIAEAAVLMEEAGRGLLAEPLLANLMTVWLLAALAPEQLADAVIERVTAGHQRLALALGEPGKRFGWEQPAATLTRDGDATLLEGRKQMVLGGGDADLVLTFARDEGGDFAVVLVPTSAEGVDVRPYPLVDGSGAADIGFAQVRITQEALIARGDRARDVAAAAIDRGVVLASAASLGAMRRAFELTLDYVKQRVQFGEAIGRNQALQHRLVDMLRMIREGDILLAEAIRANDGDPVERQLAVSALRIHLADAARTVAEEAVQMHGAIGTTDEAAISHYFRALLALGAPFGDAAHHRARYARLDRPGEDGARRRLVALAPDDEAFVAALRAFIDAELDPAARAVVAGGGHPSKPQMKAWERALATRNWLVYTWTAEQGGPGLTPLQQFLFEETLAEMHAPGNNGLAIKMAGPVIREFGSAEQRARHLPGILDGSVNWCQGYSEPGAGSDLAALATSAERDGDDYVVNGQKIWTSYAHWADWMFMLVRTSREAKRQSGITFLLVDMTTPGITVRPIVAADGHHGFNEVFFENVRVPVANRIGEEGKGWTYAKFLLSNERLGVVSLPSIKHALARAERAMARAGSDGGRLADDPAYAHRLVDLKVRLRALEGWVRRSLEDLLEGGSPGPEVSLVKIRGTELNQDLAAFTMDALAGDALPYDFEHATAPERPLGDAADGLGTTTAGYIYRRAFTILGGSTEIQKNIVSKAVLGL